MNIYVDVMPIIIASKMIVILPDSISKQLPSRGMSMIEGNINGVPFTAPLEPDGRGSHWFEISEKLIKEGNINIEKTLSLEFSLMDKWIEPEVPEDFINEIRKACLINTWDSTTTKAKWEWIRWIRSTKNQVTRQKRIEVAISKLKEGHKRPCCFDSTKCTVMEVSKSGKLAI